MRVLITEDDLDFAEVLLEELRPNYAVDHAQSGAACLALAELNPYDIIILDIGLPDMTGVEICAELRSKGITAPILMLTGHASSSHKVKALDQGADDYLVKPFNGEELLARIRALLRRSSLRPQPTAWLTAGELALNPATREVSYAGTPIELRRKEFDLLEFMIRQDAYTVTREQILEHVWDNRVNAFTNSVDVHIGQLRKKIDQPFNVHFIETVHGVGYRLTPNLMVEPQLVTNHS